MPLQLDHVVIAVRDLARAIDDYTALGFTVVPGGDHPGRSTHNALVVFGDGAYFELIAWRADAPEERWWQLLNTHGEGIVDVALLPADTAAAVDAAGVRGLRLDGPLDGGRLRPDGERLRWQVARPGTQDLPFLCGDLTPRVLRVPDGAVRTHANGATGIASVAIAVRDLPASVARWRALLGPEAHVHYARLPGSGTDVALVALGSSTIVLAAGQAGTAWPVLAGRLADAGEGPYAVALRTVGAARQGTAAPDLAHGALIEFTQWPPA